ncbi:unnamed protein product [Rotaria sp. Silwood1]|nr:unnamed protein product [Rotaria sp. Silwood1]CAF0860360.1 unnamed protein product [Rotaria sp. Silwood1]CAF4548743.1 unnamed protein product [Rotaria sp. Silwood1]
MVHWSEYFWGEGNRGFEVLSSNVKNGAIAIEEFQRFLNESVQCESVYYKSLSRLQSQLIKSQYLGTFTPIWNLMRDLFDKISSAHLTTLNFYQELLRDIHGYQDLYQKKVKTHIQKDADILRTAELISQLHNSLHILNKAKEQYHSIALDHERAKRMGNGLVNTSSSTTSQENNSSSLAQTTLHVLAMNKIERLEKKSRLAQDEYKLAIEKYNAIRNEYEKRFHDACTKFQDFEIDHIEKMLVFSLNFSEMLQRNQEQIRTAQNDFNEKLKLLSGNDLLDTFVEQKKTGTDRPIALQIEEVDNLKASTNPTTPDAISGQEDSNVIDQSDAGVPSFQAHFPVSSSNTKSGDNNSNNNNNRALSPHSATSHSNSPAHNLIISPTSNITTTSVNVTTSNNQMLRSQETNSSSEQTSNPFDVKIRRPKFAGFFGTSRKDKKEKKNEKKTSTNAKSSKTSQFHLSRDESNEVNLQNSNYEINDFNAKTDNQDGSIPNSFNVDKTKCATPEPYIQSNSSILKNELTLQLRHSVNPTSASKISISTDTSSGDDDDDDDDDNPMLKIDFKINPKSEFSPVADDETKIVNAMRLIDKNMENFITTSRGLPNRMPDLNKSLSVEPISKRTHPPPPPIPLRATLTISNSIPTDYTGHSNMFPPHDGFDPFHSNMTTNISTNQENLFAPLQSTTESKNTTSISSTDDDAEVANSFPNESLPTNKTTLFRKLQVPSFRHVNQQQPQWTSISPSITSTNPNLHDSPMPSNEHRISPSTPDTTDLIPLAIAFQEIIHVMISGNNQENWQSQIVGEMLISFPASILNLFVDPSYFSNRLQFRLKNLDHIENIITKSSLITQHELSTDSNEPIYSFDMTELHNALQNLREKNHSSRFFNLNVLNYEVEHSDVSNIPIQMSSQWTRTFDTISVNIKYSFNSSAFPNSIRINNDAVIFYTIITDGQEIKESLPTAAWSVKESKLWWKVPYVNNGTGNLSATMITTQKNTVDNDQQQPLTTSSTVNAYFLGENALFSSIDFDLACNGYRISLLKKKILSGKYESEPDQTEPLHLFQRPSVSPSATF